MACLATKNFTILLKTKAFADTKISKFMLKHFNIYFRRG